MCQHFTTCIITSDRHILIKIALGVHNNQNIFISKKLFMLCLFLC